MLASKTRSHANRRLILKFRHPTLQLARDNKTMLGVSYKKLNANLPRRPGMILAKP